MVDKLPIGLQDFEILRRENILLVDKTGRLLEPVTKGLRKSLTLSISEGNVLQSNGAF